MNWIIEHIWLILFFVWGLPLGIYRSKFRKLVYQTHSWTINIKPVFWKELKALFGNLFPENPSYLKFRNFYRFYLGIYTILFVLYFAFGSKEEISVIQVGSHIPEFSLLDQHGNTFQISSVLGKKNLVIYFYPKDDSPGCTKEACSFQDQFEVFQKADALVIGISGQSVESHQEFAEKYGLTYTLLSDEGNRVRKLFGVPYNLFGLLPGRVTFVVDKSGRVVYTFNSQIQATQHVDEAIRVLKGLH